MKLEVIPSSSSVTDDDQSNLNILFEAFGSVVSLEDIASSYCEAGRDLNATAEILCNMPGSISGTQQSSDGASSTSTIFSTDRLDEGHIVKLKPKKCSTSMGTVSNVIGKEYIKPRTQSKGLNEKLKPVKINMNDFPVAEIWGEEKEKAAIGKEEAGGTSRGQPMENDLGEFMYKMLGNGFQLDRGVIEQVIGQCGYDMPMSIDKLLDISAATLEKCDDVIGIATWNNMKNIHDVGSTSCSKQSQSLSGSGSDASGGDPSILPQKEMRRKDLPKEILESLFSAPDPVEDSTHPVRTNRQSPYGRAVTKPMEEKFVGDFTFITRQPINNRNNDANEESYDELRKAVLENWATMKEYYKASLDAFIKKEYESAQSLQKQGDFYKRKAQEADEKSSKKLIPNSDEDELCINVHYFGPKCALSQMKTQLKVLCGLPSIQFLKVVVGTAGDKKDRQRKLLITKLLEKEGIPWTEEGNGWTISIRVDTIDHSKLSW